MADPLTSPGLKRRLATLRARLWRLAAWRAWWPLLAFIALVAAAAAAGLLEGASAPVQAAFTLVSVLGVVVLFMIGKRRFVRPSPEEAADLLDRQHPMRPLSVLRDRYHRGGAESRALWQEHRRRARVTARTLALPGLWGPWRRADPLFMRYALPLALAALLAWTMRDAPGRLQNAFGLDMAALTGAGDITVQGWVTPPDHTGRAPVFLAVQGAGGEDGETESDTAGPVRVPEGSLLTLRADGSAPPLLVIEGEDPVRQRFSVAPDGGFEALAVIRSDSEVSVRRWGERASYTLLADPDAAPEALWSARPQPGASDRTEFRWSVSDDYGVERLWLELRPSDPHPADPDGVDRVAVDLGGLSTREASSDAALDLTRHRWAGLEAELRLIAVDGAGQEGASEIHRMVVPDRLLVVPLAEAIQEARLAVLREVRPYEAAEEGALPAGAASLQQGALYLAAGNRLADAPAGVRYGAQILDALSYSSAFYTKDRTIHLALSHSGGVLRSAATLQEAQGVDEGLWAAALRAEYGSASDAYKRFVAARNALERALRNGASEDEVGRRVEAFREAANRYVAARLAEQLANGVPEQPDDTDSAETGSGPQLGSNRFEEMLDSLDAMSTTSPDEARQLLGDISNMIESMQAQQSRGGGADSFAVPGAPPPPGGEGGDPDDAEDTEAEGERELTDAMRYLNELLRQQRELNDETLAEQRGERGAEPDGRENGQSGAQSGQQPGAQGQQGNQNSQSGGSGIGEGGGDPGGTRSLAEQQRDLQRLLDRLAQGERPDAFMPGGEDDDGPGAERGDRDGEGNGDEESGAGQEPGEAGGGEEGGDGEEGRGLAGRDAEGDTAEERELRRALLREALRAAGERDLADISRAQDRAAQALDRGDLAGAQRYQELATRSMRDATEDIAAALDALLESAEREGDPESGQQTGGGDSLDPLGRSLGAAGLGGGAAAGVPEESERVRARTILEELRRRYGDADSEEERLYLERLLDRF